MADSIVRLTVEDSSFNAKIKAAAKAFADFGARVTSAGVDAFKNFATGANTAKVAFQGFNTVLKANALVLVSTLAIQAGAALAEMVGDWISGASDAEDAQRKLNAEVEKTIGLLNQLDRESNFNVRAAKAMGKSTSEVLQIKLEEAKKRMTEAYSAVNALPTSAVGSDEYNKLKERALKYEQEIPKIQEEIRLDKIAQQYKTGEYAVRGGGGGSSRTTEEFDVSKIAFNSKGFDERLKFNPEGFDESLKFNPEEHAVASGLRPEDILGPSDEWEKYKDTITGAIGSIGESMSNLTEWTEDFDPFKENMEKLTKAAKQQKMAMGLASQAVSSFGAALSGIDDPGVKAAGTVMQAIASIALGFATASAQAGSLGPYAWVAFLAAGAAAMATTIATVHNLTGYAQGGIVEGNSYSGDNIYAGNAMVNAGELVLTKAMQGNLASQLQDNGMQNMNIAGRIKGTDIILSIDRSLKLEGKQLLTWGR